MHLLHLLIGTCAKKREFHINAIADIFYLTFLFYVDTLLVKLLRILHLNYNELIKRTFL